MWLHVVILAERLQRGWISRDSVKHLLHPIKKLYVAHTLGASTSIAIIRSHIGLSASKNLTSILRKISHSVDRRV